MFGLELRKKGNVSNLYKDVDTVLKKYGIESKQVPEEVKVSTVAHSLQKMFKQSYFSVCTIKDNSKLTGLVISSERMEVYQSIHCLDWRDMTEDFRSQIVAMVLDDFRPVLNYEAPIINQQIEP